MRAMAQHPTESEIQELVKKPDGEEGLNRFLLYFVAKYAMWQILWITTVKITNAAYFPYENNMEFISSYLPFWIKLLFFLFLDIPDLITSLVKKGWVTI